MCEIHALYSSKEVASGQVRIQSFWLANVMTVQAVVPDKHLRDLQVASEGSPP